MIEINLLPKEYQKRKFKFSLEKNTIYVVAAGVVVLILLAAYTFMFQVMPINKIGKNIVAYQQEESKFDPQIAKIDSLENLQKLIMTRLTAIDLLDRDRGAWIAVCSDLGSRITDYLWITDFRQLMPEAVISPKPGTNPDEGIETKPKTKPVAPPVDLSIRKATIKGQSFSLNSIATFIIRLKKSPFFNGIELMNIKLTEQNNAESYEFTINCNLNFNGTEKQTTDNIALAGNVGAGAQF
jgi:Tfp pilus assembly protein PilN